MKNDPRKYDDIKGMVRRLEGLLEAGLLSIIYYYVWRTFYRLRFFPPYFGRGKYVLLLVYLIFVLLIFHLCDGFKFGHLKLTDVCSSQIISLFAINFITYLQLCLIANRMIAILPIILLMGIDILLSVLYCYFFTAIYHSMYVSHNMILIYGKDSALDLKFKMDTRQDNYTITEIVHFDVDENLLRQKIAAHDAVIINDVPSGPRNRILKYCYHNEIRTYVVPKISDIVLRGAPDITLFDTPLVLIKGRGLQTGEAFIKRTFDIILCLLAMLPFALITVLIGLSIKIEDRGSIFYTQDRMTKNGQVFKMYKFRSMKEHPEEEETFQNATTDDPRITHVGKFIRKCRMDELPQILNILKGDMSWVGPRAENLPDMEKHKLEVPEYEERLKVKAGLTGYAQVYGKYNTSAYDKLRMDLMYIENYSFLLDTKLILMTLRILFKKESTEGFDRVDEQRLRREELIRESRKNNDA